jgi:2-polyprenyl-6-methoxyphenol hydroxylase-like FAD-dependent oxidoreductase
MTDLLTRVRCCIAGGGPAGVMLGFLLARAGVEVLVLEKHADFLRDFRGDTVHPSTLELMYELGLLERFLQRPHQKLSKLRALFGDEEVTIADLAHLPAHCRFIAFMPQWEFLNFLTEEGKRYPAFHLKMQTEVVELLEEEGRVVGVRAQTLDGTAEIRADLVVGADGRRSTVRERAGLIVDNLGAPMDVAWMRLSRRPEDLDQPLGRFRAGRIFIMLNRGDYWQCGLVISKGGFDDLKKRGLESLRAEMAESAPFMRDRVGELRDWNDVKLLTVTVDRLRQWSKPGLLCIGDAAHAMSPVGGVGINLAIQDAVAAANLLAASLQRGDLSPRDLEKVQRRRHLPVVLIQRLQVLVQNRLIRRVLTEPAPESMPWGFRVLQWLPFLSRFPARLIGLGFRPEHIQTPALHRM